MRQGVFERRARRVRFLLEKSWATVSWRHVAYVFLKRRGHLRVGKIIRAPQERVNESSSSERTDQPQQPRTMLNVSWRHVPVGVLCRDNRHGFSIFTCMFGATKLVCVRAKLHRNFENKWQKTYPDFVRSGARSYLTGKMACAQIGGD